METPETKALRAQEMLIHTHVLKHTHYSDIPFEQKQQQFKETCYAIKTIIKQKLYRKFSSNLEQYFLKKFNVSRAQCLEGIHPIPHKYRICKELKQRTGLGKSCRDMWQLILKSGSEESQIDQFDFDTLPKFTKNILKESVNNQEMVDSNHQIKDKRRLKSLNVFTETIQPIPPEVNLISQNCFDRELYRDYLNLSSPNACQSIDLQPPLLLRSDTVNNHAEYNNYSKLDPVDIQQEFLKCQNSMKSLADLGYQLTPLINGRWCTNQITEWRIVRSDALSENVDPRDIQEENRCRSNSFENLLLAANACGEWK